MPFKRILLQLICAVVLVYCEPPVVGISGNANHLVDKIINYSRPLIVKNGFDKVEAVNVSESIRSINVTGLSTVRRIGNSTLKIEGQSILLEINLGFSDIVIFYAILHEVKWFPDVVGKGNATTSFIGSSVKFRILLEKELHLSLEDFQVTNWGDLKVTLKGENFLGNIAGYFTDWKYIQRRIITKIKTEVPPLILSFIQETLTQLGFVSSGSSEYPLKKITKKSVRDDNHRKEMEKQRGKITGNITDYIFT